MEKITRYIILIFPINVSTDIKRDVEAFKPDVILNVGRLYQIKRRTLSQWELQWHYVLQEDRLKAKPIDILTISLSKSQSYKKKFEIMGCSVSIAFGTNTDLFTPVPEQKKIFDTCNFLLTQVGNAIIFTQKLLKIYFP